MKFADFVIAETLEGARAELKRLGPNGMPVAGGTCFQYLSDRPGITAVDISRIGLRGIRHEGNTFHIGANTTLTDMVRYQTEGWVLGEIATRIPTHQIRNISTAAGNIARLFPWSELPLGLLVLDGTVKVQNDHTRSLSAREFFAARAAKGLQPGDLITGITVNAANPPTGFGYRKENVTNSAFALVCAAAALTIQDGTITRARVAVGSAVPAPIPLPALEQALEGAVADVASFSKPIAEAAAAVRWKGREGMSDEYAARIAPVIIGDALEMALRRAQGDAA